ncbi:unnamed protein product [Closterium sp. Naga37s-1]|nr:unnamed protein product [Closterium sp. Naga37s-1]
MSGEWWELAGTGGAGSVTGGVAVCAASALAASTNGTASGTCTDEARCKCSCGQLCVPMRGSATAVRCCARMRAAVHGCAQLPRFGRLRCRMRLGAAARSCAWLRTAVRGCVRCTRFTCALLSLPAARGGHVLLHALVSVRVRAARGCRCWLLLATHATSWLTAWALVASWLSGIACCSLTDTPTFLPPTCTGYQQCRQACTWLASLGGGGWGRGERA